MYTSHTYLHIHKHNLHIHTYKHVQTYINTQTYIKSVSKLLNMKYLIIIIYNNYNN